MIRTTLVRPLAAAVALLALGAALVADAATIDVQANQPQIAGDPGSNASARFPTNKQNETTIAVNPANASHLIGAANDEQKQPRCGPGPVRGAGAPANDCSFFADVGTSGVYTSSDGGASWTNRGLLPGFSDNGGALVSDGDPVVVYGPKPGAGGFSFSHGARAYYASLASFATGEQHGNQAPELISVSRSDDDGAHWSDPVIAARANGHVFNDKESIWADVTPASPFFGRVYVSWSQFRSPPETNNALRVVFSEDGGVTWSVPRQISAAYNNAARGGRQGSVVRTGPDGAVYAVWEDSDNKVGAKQVVSVSRDGGDTWSKPITIAAVDDLKDPIPGANFRTDSFPSLAVSPADGAVYAAWADELGGSSGRIVVSRSTDHGASWSAPAAVSGASEGYAFFQGLDVAPNGRVDVAYQALKAADASTYGVGNATVNSYYVKSTDGGAHWSAPANISTASSDPAASSQNNLRRQFWGDYNTLVSTNANAWFIYTDTRSGAGCAAVDAFQHSIDAGAPIAKPAPGLVCPAQFGNSDIQVAKITP